MPEEHKQMRIEIKEVDQHYSEAPLIYVDGAQTLAAIGDTVRLNFYQDKLTSTTNPDDDGLIHRSVCLRLVMTKRTFVQVFDWLKEAAEQARKELAPEVPGGSGPNG